MTNFTENHDTPSGALQVTLGIDPDNRVQIHLGEPMSGIILEAGSALVLATLIMEKALIATSAGGVRPVGEFISDEAAFRRELHGADLPPDEERVIDIDMGHWTLRVIVGPRGLAELRKAVTE